MTTEVHTKLKKDLAQESNKILEEFRGDLKISVARLEDQLRDKVDKFNLEDFGKKIDHKFNGDLQKKLDKTDMKRNNSYLNRKLDNLENKISKTLVDTLIDLQMEEAPLIVKKSILGDKCVSCNQILNNNSVTTQTPPYQVNVPQSGDERYKLRSIQDNSNKYNSGSYSRILSFANPETLPNELRNSFAKNFGGKENPMNNTTTTGVNSILPDIKRKSAMNSPRRKVGSSLSKIDESTEHKYTAILNDELEKKVVNPHSILSVTNKIYESLEKKGKI